MADDSGEKKHEATDFRRQKAREDGNVARSSDLTSAILLLVGVVLLDTTGPAIANSLIGLLHEVLTSEATLKTDTRTVMIDLIRQTGQSSLALLPLLLGMLATSVVVHYAQVGPLWLPEKLGMDITRIDPIQGFKRLLSITNVTRLGFGLVKIALVTGILIAGVWSKWDSILALGTTGIGAVGGFVWETMIELCRNVAIALVILSIVDYAFQRWKYEQDLRMTDEEMREEMKMTQGDPHTKSRRRKVQRELAQQRLSVDVPKADVVVTNPTELAIALQYDPKTMRAPIVLAKGADLVAAKIRKIALQHGIPIVERKPLAQALFREVDVGKPIPATEYTAVAEVLKYVYQVKGRSIQEITETLQSQTEPIKKDPKRGQPT